MTNDPLMIAYGLKQTKSGKSVWTPTGRAYPHDEGSGLTVVFDALPLI